MILWKHIERVKLLEEDNRKVCDTFKKSSSPKVSSPKDDIKVSAKKADCIRKVANWSISKPYHRFDTKKFDVHKTAIEIPTCSPKLQSLLDTIQRLDAEDKKRGQLHKHFIYSDLKAAGHGPKMIAAGLVTLGMKCCLHVDGKKIDFSVPSSNKYENFGVLCSSTMFGDKLRVKKRKEMLSVFNSRPDNIYGEKIRIMILDSGFKEGIDLFDVKYVHIYEPQLTHADMTQAVGRATRFCGQKGLKFIPNEGWKLDVYTYTSNTTQHTIEELYSLYAGVNLSEVALREQLEKIRELIPQWIVI